MRGRRAIPLVDRFWPKVDQRGPDECWPWKASLNVHGYGMIGGENGGPNQIASRVAWTLTNGPIPPGLNVRHKCNNPPCCNPAHLLLGTQEDNMQDAVRAHRICHGERHPKARLTEDIVWRIRLDPRGRNTIAKEYGLDKRTVKRIQEHEVWDHL